MNTFTFKYEYHGKVDEIDVTVPGGIVSARKLFYATMRYSHWVDSIKILEIICPEKDSRRS